jgi:hypothetical protein
MERWDGTGIGNFRMAFAATFSIASSSRLSGDSAFE